jgi:hypothetical protein
MSSRTYNAQYYQNHKLDMDATAIEWRQKERKRLIKEFGGKCIKCSYDNSIALDFDHVKNDGWSDKKRHRKNVIFWVKQNPERFQLLCKNCNWIKEYHKRRLLSLCRRQVQPKKD